MKLEILIDDDETRALWETAKKAKAEVESWPAWKHNEVPRASTAAIGCPRRDRGDRAPTWPAIGAIAGRPGEAWLGDDPDGASKLQIASRAEVRRRET